jgi:hypothetical protein
MLDMKMMYYPIRPVFTEIHYTGLDIQSYKCNTPNMADVYVKVTHEKFANTTQYRNDQVDKVQ